MAAYQLQTKNSLSEIGSIYDAFSRFLEENGMMNDEHYNQCCLCIDEIFSNIVNYAYKDRQEHVIEIYFKCDIAAEKVEIILTDDGTEFNPLTEAVIPDLSLNIDERSIGGLGILIVKNTMTSTGYERRNNRNIFTMVKIFK